MKTFLVFLIAVYAICIANAQIAAVQPKFEVASVKRTERCFTGNSSIDPGSVSLKGLPLRAILSEAFKVKMDQVEGPSWLDTDCYEISAKIPEGVSKEQLPAMLQALLAERFKLVARKEDRARSGFSLVVDKGGLKFKEDDPEANFMGKDAKKGLTLYGFGGGRLKGVMTMAVLASNLSKEGYGPIQDATGLTGRYDIDLTWTKEQALAPGAVDASTSAAALPVADNPAGASLFTALRESGGLKLERHSVQVQFVVIDRIERNPTEN